MSTYTKMDRGDFVREGFCPAPYTDITRSCPASQIFVPEFLDSPPTRQSKKKNLRLIPSVEEVAKISIIHLKILQRHWPPNVYGKYGKYANRK